MELKNVKLIEKLAVETGTTKSGKDWKKQLFVVEETDTQYPKPIALVAWNEVVDKLSDKIIGTPLNCGVRLESREYNSKWYTDVVCWRVNSASKEASAAAPVAAEPANDLPF